MRISVFVLSIILSFTGSVMSQNYFTGELFEAYEWDLKTMNKLDLKLEKDIVLRRRMLSKREGRIGDRVKENDQYYDEVTITKRMKLEVIEIKDNIIKIQFARKSEYALSFGPSDYDEENYVVLVKEIRGAKGVTEYRGMPFRVLNGSRLIIGKIKKKNLPPKREQKLASQWKGNGSGILIDKEGYIMTNYHVIKDANEIAVYSPSFGDVDLKAKVIMKDKANDLAILKIIDDTYRVPKKEIPYSIMSKVQDVGTDVFTLGYPLALSQMGKAVKFTEGSISSKTGYNDDVSMYQISVPIQPGNSGGPLFDLEGNLVGIINAKVVGESIDNVSYAIKSSYAQSLIESSDENITTPAGFISGSIEFLIKKLDDYVFMVKVD